MRRVLRHYTDLNRARQAFVLTVILPTLLAAIYYAFLASDIYVSETQFTVRTHGQTASTGLLAGLVGAAGGSVSGQDLAIVSDYIRSRDMLDALQTRLDLRAHYSSRENDRIGRLAADASEEQFLKYYQKKLEIREDTVTGIMTLRTKAFDPEVARAMAAHIVDLSEQLVNALSQKMTDDGLKFAREELERAEQRLQAAGQEVTRFRNATATVDPTQKTSAVLGIVTSLEGQRAAAQAELSELRSFLREDSAQVVAVRNRIQALEDQILQENRRLTGEEKAQLTTLLHQYERLALDREVAHQFYTSTLATLESSRMEAMRQRVYLMTFVRPALPDEAIEPKRLWNTLTVFIVALLIYVIGGLLWSTVRDHMGMEK